MRDSLTGLRSVYWLRLIRRKIGTLNHEKFMNHSPQSPLRNDDNHSSPTNHSSLDTAVLLLAFNRPKTTKIVFEAVRTARPQRLYLATDGPREGKENDVEKIKAVQEIVSFIDWPCDVKTLNREANLGCKLAVSEAISWFFEHESEGIILEDDCLPHPDFFQFCQSLLNRYRDDPRVSVITGNNFQKSIPRSDSSYYFSKYPHCWGWATWKQAWQTYSGEMKFWPSYRSSTAWLDRHPLKQERAYWDGVFELVTKQGVDSWAYPWTASVWFAGGLTATPNVNLVSNIGFGDDSTHTSSADSEFAAMPTQSIGVISHPAKVYQNEEADLFVFDHHFGGKWRRFPFSVLHLPISALRYAKRLIQIRSL